jgi:hypothetical protein
MKAATNLGQGTASLVKSAMPASLRPAPKVSHKVEVYACDPAITTPQPKPFVPNKNLGKLAARLKKDTAIETRNNNKNLCKQAPAPAAAALEEATQGALGAPALPAEEPGLTLMTADGAAPALNQGAESEDLSAAAPALTPEEAQVPAAAAAAPDTTQEEAQVPETLMSAAAAPILIDGAEFKTLLGPAADNHPAAATTKLFPKLFLRLLSLELPRFNLNLKPIDFKIEFCNFSLLPSFLGGGSNKTTMKNKTVTESIQLQAAAASPLVEFRAQLLAKYGLLGMYVIKTSPPAAPAPQEDALAAAAALQALLETVVVAETAVVAGGAHMAAPATTKPVRGPVSRKVHWAGKRLREMGEVASRCCDHIQEGAVKCLSKVQGSLKLSTK